MTTCADCGKERKIRARGLCGSCYQIHQAAGTHHAFTSKYRSRKRPCASCGETKTIHAKDLCNRCYHDARRVTCVECGRREILRGLGMCNACYQAHLAARKRSDAEARAKYGTCLHGQCIRPAVPDCHPEFRFCQQHLDVLHRLITTDKESDVLPPEWAPTPDTRAILPGTGLKQKVRNK